MFPSLNLRLSVEDEQLKFNLFYRAPLEAFMGTSDTVMFMQKTKRDCEYDLHMTGKYIPDKTHNLVRDGVEFEIEGFAKDARLRRHPTQNEIFQFISANPDCRQKAIVKALSLDKAMSVVQSENYCC